MEQVLYLGNCHKQVYKFFYRLPSVADGKKLLEAEIPAGEQIKLPLVKTEADVEAIVNGSTGLVPCKEYKLKNGLCSLIYQIGHVIPEKYFLDGVDIVERAVKDIKEAAEKDSELRLGDIASSLNLNPAAFKINKRKEKMVAAPRIQE